MAFDASPNLLILGLGYAGEAIARAALARGFAVRGTHRQPGQGAEAGPVPAIPFEAAGPAIAAATHLVVTIPPGEDGDPVLARHGEAIRAGLGARLRWVGYLSTTGVYGDRGGAWVDETTPAAPGQPRSLRRRQAELAWEAALAGRAWLDLFRTGGIYGPGRSALDEVRAGKARRVIRPGHAFGRIHRDDIARAVAAAAAQAPQDQVPARPAPVGAMPRVLHLVDDEPAEPALVVEEAARLLGLPPPPALPFEAAWAEMSPMARSFWSERRLVANARTRAALGLEWRYPSYREGLRQIAAEQAGHREA
ncbi:SDR family NAD(P)-dependent oxidoreductase [Roseomonas gilardii subsp. gilardii]|uniref:SDR family NAD(P)-dependent oxidoreductase n=1 Tax=Roseomonas gilardii TaxID=257708 RepID=UPI001FF9DADD|nr:SDR family NAD(P)-dependent oxidoreductase [Roseomonas gilardii]UPG71286.1 SDR family NAD(P)-dependent oxidoreductase [Roseomonas gilardii subsp. gilardii]